MESEKNLADFFPGHLVPADVKRQITVPAGGVASEIDLKRGRYRPAIQKVSVWRERSVQDREGYCHSLPS